SRRAGRPRRHCDRRPRSAPAGAHRASERGGRRWHLGYFAPLTSDGLSWTCSFSPISLSVTISHAKRLCSQWLITLVIDSQCGAFDIRVRRRRPHPENPDEAVCPWALLLPRFGGSAELTPRSDWAPRRWRSARRPCDGALPTPRASSPLPPCAS